MTVETSVLAARSSDATDGCVDVTIRVRYAETDQMGVVYYANYLVWFEIGRTELLRQRGIAYKDMEADGCYVVVTEATCRFGGSARYDDVVTIRTRVGKLQSRVVSFVYEVLGDGGQPLATGQTTHVITDRDGRPRRLPDRYRQALVGPGR